MKYRPVIIVVSILACALAYGYGAPIDQPYTEASVRINCVKGILTVKFKEPVVEVVLSKVVIDKTCGVSNGSV